MVFIGICLLTDDVPRLRDFFTNIFNAAFDGDEIFSLVKVKGAILSICSTDVMEEMAPDSMSGAGNGNFTIEVEVDEVDKIYEELMHSDVLIVKKPTTQLWGRRSLWIRDPDGNIVNLFCKV